MEIVRNEAKLDPNQVLKELNLPEIRTKPGLSGSERLKMKVMQVQVYTDVASCLLPWR